MLFGFERWVEMIRRAQVGYFESIKVYDSLLKMELWIYAHTIFSDLPGPLKATEGAYGILRTTTRLIIRFSNDRFVDYPETMAVRKGRMLPHEIVNQAAYIHELRVTGRYEINQDAESD